MASGFMTTFGGDNTGFIRAVKGMEQATGKMASSVAGSIRGLVGAYVGIEAFKALIGDAAKAALAFDAFSDRQGTTYEETQRLSASFVKMGLTLGDAETALMKMTASRKDAAESNDAMVDSFAKFGITIADLNNPMMTNADLLKKAGVALQTMKIDPSTTAALKELFGRSGPKMLNALKDLGEGHTIALMDDDTIAKIDEAERALVRLKNTWNTITAETTAGAMSALSTALGVLFDPAVRERIRKNKKSFSDYGKAHPEESENTYATSKAYTYAEAFGSDAQKEAALMAQANTAYTKHGREEAVKYFGKDRADKIDAEMLEAASGKGKKNTDEKLYTDKRRHAEKIAAAQQDLDEASRDALIDQMQPLQQQVAYRKQIVDLLEKADFIEAHMGENLESIALRKQALGLEQKANGKDSGSSFSQPEKMAIDEMAKNNLSVGIKAYEPMMNATTINTTATNMNTAALAKTTEVLSSIQLVTSVDPWS